MTFTCGWRVISLDFFCFSYIHGYVSNRIDSTSSRDLVCDVYVGFYSAQRHWSGLRQLVDWLVGVADVEICQQNVHVRTKIVSQLIAFTMPCAHVWYIGTWKAHQTSEYAYAKKKHQRIHPLDTFAHGSRQCGMFRTHFSCVLVSSFAMTFRRRH